MSDLKEIYTKDDLPYDKFKRLGPASLTDAELLAIILRTGTRDKTPIDLGKEILENSWQKSGLLGLYHYTMRELMRISGIGEVKATQLLCIAEIAKRTAYMQARYGLSFSSPDSVAAYYMEKLRHQETEQVLLVLLDNKNRLIDDIVLSKGTVNSSLVSPREVFLAALRQDAVAVMLLHNHPSGDPTPSRNDRIITNKIKEVSDLIDIPLIDHIIIGDNRFISFKQKGLL